MQPFEQCGGTGGVCSAQATAGIHTCADEQYPGAICPQTFSCQRQSEAFWQCLPQQLQAAAADASATANGTSGGRNRTATGAGNVTNNTYQPAQIAGAGFRRYNISVWPNCAPWEYAIASRCVPAPNRTRDEVLAEQSADSGCAGHRGVGMWQGVWLLVVTAMVAHGVVANVLL